MSRRRLSDSDDIGTAKRQRFSFHASHNLNSHNQTSTDNRIDNRMDYSVTHFTQYINPPNTQEESNDWKLKRILEWISPLDFGPIHIDILNKVHSGTGQWFLMHDQFREFVEGEKSLLFCCGIGGVILAYHPLTLLTETRQRELENLFLCRC